MRQTDPLVLRALLALGLATAGALNPTIALAADATGAAPKAAPKAAAQPADGAPRQGSPGKGSGAVLTREQLRQCIAEQDRIKAESAGLVAAQADLASQRAEIERLAAAQKEEQATLDRTSEAAVNAYNAKLQERSKLTEAYLAATPVFNGRVEKLDADKQNYAKACADRRYDEADLADIKAGK